MRTTVLLKKFQGAGVLSAAAWTLLAASAASATPVAIYHDAPTFLNSLASSYLENFNSAAPLGQQVDALGNSVPMKFSSGNFHYSADVPGDFLYITNNPANLSDQALSTYSFNTQIVFTFEKGIDAVGGNFFNTAADGTIVAGLVTVTLDDGTTQTFDNQDGLAFTGFISANSDITSLSVSGDLNDYATVDDLYVGDTPEPQSIFLLLGGLTAGALRLRWRKTHPRV